MRKAKARKSNKRTVHQATVLREKELKVAEKANKAKYEAWLNLPEDQWTEARKAANTQKV